MSDDADDDESDEQTEPAVELGDAPSVEGAPAARVAARLRWPKTRSAVIEQEGDVEIRTPDGPRPVAEVLEAADETLFDSRHAFLDTVESVIGTGPVETADTED